MAKNKFQPWQPRVAPMEIDPEALAAYRTDLRRGHLWPQTLVEQLLNPQAPAETGTWSEDTGFVRDETDEDRAARALLMEEIKRHATGR